ncbi:cytochrome P450 1A1-like [Babylonia areolata]|uniref:cytochrome P450 1A1-like n=1 Tax=Babylonia areolata TaxID=304850 RepID=UPI003FD58EFF
MQIQLLMIWGKRDCAPKTAMERKESASDDYSSAGGFTTVAAVFVVTLLMVKLVMTMRKKRYNLPPGPWGLPLVGYLPFFGPLPHVTFMEMRKKYGDIISISMGSWPAVVISGSDAIKEALVTKRDDFAGRPAFTAARLSENITSLSALTYGPLWKLHRKTLSNVLYNHSNARKNPIENIIRSDAYVVIKEYLSHGDKSFCPLASLDLAAFSMVYQLCYDRHNNVRDDHDFMAFLKHLREFSKLNRPGNPINAMPWLRHFMPSKIANFMEMLEDNKKLRAKKVEEHESSFDKDSLRDITDGLIHAGNQLTEEEKALGTDKKRLIGNVFAIFGAGSANVSSTLRWCVALMTAFPEVQEEVFQQINDVVGQGREITLADRPKLPLVEATVYEVFRYVGVFPFALQHVTTCDTTLQGYDIPEGTVVLVNLYSAFMDEKVWGDPKIFRPQRFLDSEGQLDRGLVEQVPAFSLGRRRCVGEFVARMELFLFFATLMQRLKFFRPPGHPAYGFKTSFAMTVDVVEPFEVCVSERE